MIFILEDNDERVLQFRSVLKRIAPDMPVRFWRSAHEMLTDLVDGLEQATIISLDHDLNRLADEPDPGTGYDIAKVFEELIPCCPIIIHTSNGERGAWMKGALERAGWQYERVYPFGDDWIDKDWGPVVRRLLER